MLIEIKMRLKLFNHLIRRLSKKNKSNNEAENYTDKTI